MQTRSLAVLALLAAAAQAGGAPAERQELYVHDLVGNLYRVDDYATAPTAVPVAATGLGRMMDAAFDLERRMVSCSAGTFPLTRFFLHDAAFLPTQTATNQSLAWVSGLDVGGDGTLWARSPNTPFLWTVNAAAGGATPAAVMFAPSPGDVAVAPNGHVLATDVLGNVDDYDPVTGVATILGSHGLGHEAFGFEIDRDGTAYLGTRAGDLYRLDLATMNRTHLGNLGVSIAGCAFRLPADPRVGTELCAPGAINSTGVSGSLAARGSASIADDDLTFLFAGLPADATGLLLASPTQGSLVMPRGIAGELCVAAPLEARRIAVRGTGASELSVDVAALGVQPGDTRHFQCWYRDAGSAPAACFTNALSVAFR